MKNDIYNRLISECSLLFIFFFSLPAISGDDSSLNITAYRSINHLQYVSVETRKKYEDVPTYYLSMPVSITIKSMDSPFTVEYKKEDQETFKELDFQTGKPGAGYKPIQLGENQLQEEGLYQIRITSDQGKRGTLTIRRIEAKNERQNVEALVLKVDAYRKDREFTKASELARKVIKKAEKQSYYMGIASYLLGRMVAVTAPDNVPDQEGLKVLKRAERILKRRNKLMVLPERITGMIKGIERYKTLIKNRMQIQKEKENKDRNQYQKNLQLLKSQSLDKIPLDEQVKESKKKPIRFSVSLKTNYFTLAEEFAGVVTVKNTSKEEVTIPIPLPEKQGMKWYLKPFSELQFDWLLNTSSLDAPIIRTKKGKVGHAIAGGPIGKKNEPAQTFLEANSKKSWEIRLSQHMPPAREPMKMGIYVLKFKYLDTQISFPIKIIPNQPLKTTTEKSSDESTKFFLWVVKDPDGPYRVLYKEWPIDRLNEEREEFSRVDWKLTELSKKKKTVGFPTELDYYRVLMKREKYEIKRDGKTITGKQRTPEKHPIYNRCLGIHKTKPDHLTVEPGIEKNVHLAWMNGDNDIIYREIERRSQEILSQQSYSLEENEFPAEQLLIRKNKKIFLQIKSNGKTKQFEPSSER